jgi:hypothetical protein
VPGFNPNQPSPVALLEKLTEVLQTIPAGPSGFDRSMVWVYLIGGSVSLPGSNIRALIESRVAQMGDDAHCGSFGRMATVLREVWSQNDAMSGASTPSSNQPSEPTPMHLHWRDVMQMKGWDFLLI